MTSKLKGTKDFFESKQYYDSDSLLSDEGRKRLQTMGRQKAWESEGFLNKAKRFGSEILRDDVNEIEDPARRERLKNILNRR